MVQIKEIIKEIEDIHLIGNEEESIDKLLKLDTGNYDPHALMWISKKNNHLIKDINSGSLICEPFDETIANPNCNYLVCNNPRTLFQKILVRYFYKKQVPYIAATAIIDGSAVIGRDVSIGENVVIEKSVSIGNNSSIGHNSVIKENTIIKNEVVIGCNCVIGNVGFGYEKNEEGEYEFIPHIGNVVIEDKVEIGNCTVVDRGVLGSTQIKENAKIDNLVHIAHGVTIGQNALIIANAMLGGSVSIGKNTWIAPGATIKDNLTIGENVTVGLGAVITKDIPDKETWVGNPGKELSKFIEINDKIKSL
jgi:UDP-3-O-[3-hydroxymyristoyl] glucosamine N-acyltransferase